MDLRTVAQNKQTNHPSPFNKTPKVISCWPMTHLGVSWLSHSSTDTTFLSKATEYFSHMHHKGEAKNPLQRKFTPISYLTSNFQVTGQICYIRRPVKKENVNFIDMINGRIRTEVDSVSPSG